MSIPMPSDSLCDVATHDSIRATGISVHMGKVLAQMDASSDFNDGRLTEK